MIGYSLLGLLQDDGKVFWTNQDSFLPIELDMEVAKKGPGKVGKSLSKDLKKWRQEMLDGDTSNCFITDASEIGEVRRGVHHTNITGNPGYHKLVADGPLWVVDESGKVVLPKKHCHQGDSK